MTEFTLDKLPKKVLARIDLQTAFMASRCVVAAERLQLFRKIQGKELTAAAIGRKVGISGWRITTFLAALVSLGLLTKRSDLYSNSRLTEKYFIQKRSIYWTRLYSEQCVKDYEAFLVLDEMLKTQRSYQSILGIERKGYIEEMEDDPRWAHDFTHMLYHDHETEAKALAEYLDLRNHKRVMDLGGGSGVMSIALVRKYKHLQVCVLDIEAVVRVTKNIINRQKLTGQIETVAGDMNKHIPSGYDVIVLCDAESYSVDLLRRANGSLPPGGLIVLAGQFFTDDYIGPFHRLMWQLRSQRFWLVTRKQAADNLRQSGFEAIKIRRVHPDMWVITGRKGRRTPVQKKRA